jgi:NAD(P)-dependent dehydrogenase (short-subunit alcohol dehydrogenase family)
VSPGFTRTAALEAGIASGSVNKGLIERYAAMNRMVEPVEVAQVIAWLLSPLSSGVTGINLPVDAGFLSGEQGRGADAAAAGGDEDDALAHFRLPSGLISPRVISFS